MPGTTAANGPKSAGGPAGGGPSAPEAIRALSGAVVKSGLLFLGGDGRRFGRRRGCGGRRGAALFGLGALGFGGIGGAFVGIAKILFYIAIALFLIFALLALFAGKKISVAI